MVAEEGKTMGSMGIIQLDVFLGSKQFSWPTYVAPITDDFLSGCDIFDALDLTLNTKQGLLVEGVWIPCTVTKKDDNIARVTLADNVIVPNNSEVIVMGKCTSLGKFTKYATVEPIFEDNRELLVARALTDTSKENIPILLANLSDKPVKLKKGYLVGELQPVDGFAALGDRGSRSTPEADPVRMGALCESAGPLISPEFCCREGPNILKVGTRMATSPTVGTQDSSGDDNLDFMNVAGFNAVPNYLSNLYEKSCQMLTSEQHKKMLAEVLIGNCDAFAKTKLDLGTCSLVKHRIDTGLAPPIRQPLRRTPKGFEDEEEKYLKQQIDAGVVVPSSSAWASPVCLVRKKDGSVRWCVDYRRLNDVTTMDAYPLPRIDTCLDCLPKARYFSTADLQHGYWQLKIDSRDQCKTAFITKYGLFEYTKLPMGLSSAPSTFQRCMELVFRGLQWKSLLIYLDDLIIFSSDIPTHLQKLGEMLKLLKGTGLKLKPLKCHLLKTEVLFLGHIVSQQGLKPNPDLIETVQIWESPRKVKQIQQFMGLCNYYRRFILGFSDLAAPITELTKKDVPFN